MPTPPEAAGAVAEGSSAEEPKPKRKYTRRKSVAPAVEGDRPEPAEPPKRKARARSKTPATVLTLPDSNLPWAGQGGQVEPDGIVSSRGAARLAASDVENEQVRQPKRTGKRRLQRGAAAIEGDKLSKAVMEQTLRSDGAGNTIVDRATLGKGEVNWYGVGVVVGKEKKFKEVLQQRMEATPLAVDETTGEILPRTEVEVLVPTRKVASISQSGRKTSRTIKYMDGGLVFLRCALSNDFIDFIQDMPYFRSWRDEVAWTYPDMGTVVLPQPVSKEAMDSLNSWLHGEVAPEDLPQIDEEAAKMDPVAPIELNEQGNAIIQRDFTGSYINPNAWYDGNDDAPQTPKRSRSRSPTAGRTAELAAQPASVGRGRSSSKAGTQVAQRRQDLPSPSDGQGLDEDHSIELAERYFGSQKKFEAQEDSNKGKSSSNRPELRKRPSARDAPPYPNGDHSLFEGDFMDGDMGGLMGLDDFEDLGYGGGSDILAPSMPPPRGSGRLTHGPGSVHGGGPQQQRQQRWQPQGRGDEDRMFDDMGGDGFGGMSGDWGGLAGGRQPAWTGGRQANPSARPLHGADRRRQFQGGSSSSSSGYIDGPDFRSNAGGIEEQGGYLQRPGLGGKSTEDEQFGDLDFEFMDFDDDLDAIDMSDEDLMGLAVTDNYSGGMGAPMWGGQQQAGRGQGDGGVGGISYQSFDGPSAGRFDGGGDRAQRGGVKGRGRGGYSGRSNFGGYGGRGRGGRGGSYDSGYGGGRGRGGASGGRGRGRW